ncbi:MAG: hypothetical protein MZU97_24180 [Bacillus subtilis]|nr:hypothetical protein [Bacillus subtilis]
MKPPMMSPPFTTPSIISECFLEFQQIAGDLEATFVYTTKVLDEANFVYILDGENPASELFSPYGSLDATTPIEWQVFNTGIAGYTNLQSFEKWGTFLSGYAPIRDPVTDEILGLVGVDYSSAHVQTLLNALMLTMIIGVSLLTSSDRSLFLKFSICDSSRSKRIT